MSTKGTDAISVPKWTRITQVGIAVVSCFFSAGIVFGYAALKPILISEGVYRDSCTKGEISRQVRVCVQQDIRLNLIFTTAAVATNVWALPVGAVLDRYGPRFCGICGSILIAVGCLLLAFAPELDFDAYIPGYISLALGGPFIFISSFHLSNTFPHVSGLILSMLTGAFDASSANFLFYRLIYQRNKGTFGPKHFFLTYLIVPIGIFAVQLLIMPKESYRTVDEMVQAAAEEAEREEIPQADDLTTSMVIQHRRARRDTAVSEISALLGPKVMDQQRNKERDAHAISGVYGVLHGKTAWQQIWSPWWILLTLFAMVQMVRINYFVATIRGQYEYLLGDNQLAAQVNGFFDVALPLAGVVGIPFIGILLDRTSTFTVIFTLFAACTIIGGVGIIPYLWAAYTNVILFTLYRPFYYTAISDYSAKVFGFQTFGTVYGLINSLSGIFNLLQTVLDTVTHFMFARDPVPINVGLMAVGGVLSLSLAVYVGVQSRRIKARKTLERNGTIEEEDGF